jgi:hypothetical protein
MLLPKGGVTWKSAKARLPPYQQILRFVFRTRILVLVAVTITTVLTWRGLRGSAKEMQRCVHKTRQWTVAMFRKN